MAEGQTNKVYCANCKHCKLVRTVTNDGKYLLRVRCSKGKWKKKLGEEKMYRYCTVIRRSLDNCDSYNPMGDSRIFMRELRESLPLKDEEYSSPYPSA